MLADDGADVVKAVLSAAKQGDMQAARMVLDRVVPPRKGRPLQMQLPEIATAGDVVTALGAVIKDMAAGAITPDEAATIAGVLEAKRAAIETGELEARIARLEQEAASAS